MSKQDLRAAMQALNVNIPLKLATRAPAFVAPIGTNSANTLVENPTQVEKTTEAANQTHVPNSTQVERESLVPIRSGVENRTQVNKTTTVEKETQVQNTTRAENRTQALRPTPVSKTTEVQATNSAALKKATEQDSSVVFEARASVGLEKGYTRLPNSILMKMANGDLTRGEIKILLLIARFTISFQKKTAPLSKTVLERQSGLRGAGVLEALSGLVEKNLIVKEQGDQHRPNSFGLVLPPEWDQLMGIADVQVVKTTTVENPPQVQNPTWVENIAPVPKSTAGEVRKTTPAPVENPTPFKDIKIYKNNNSLSELPEDLKIYFENLKPQRKRESELHAFWELREDYDCDEISNCLKHLTERGVGENSEPCHSPMAFLSKAINSVLAELNRFQEIANEQLQIKKSKNQKIQDELDAQKNDEEIWAQKEADFIKAFPTEAAQTTEIKKQCIGTVFRPETNAGRAFAVGKWVKNI
jgi:phage replication O-like protein O